MANVRVALRVRPLSKRETEDGGRIIVEVDGKVAKIRNIKMNNRPDGFGDSREKVVTFGFDYCYWSVNPEDPQYASQDVVFQDLGTEVLSGAVKGYNMCLFAYGQTGSGKTYTMLGTPVALGLTPRICEGLFIREEDYPSLPSSCGIKISFLEIYNERVRDLLMQPDQKKSHTLRVREHPEMGPYVQGLSQHVVTNYKQVIQLLEEGIANRVTAATHVHETSSRSHAIFTICYTQAILENNLPSEIASKISLVDLAGSERADPSYCKDRITEGANINKSLVTLGIVISTLAQNSQVFSCCQSLISAASDGDDGGIPSSSSGTSSGGRTSRRQSYIPYRDSVLTWLLKDSLGGNSKTIMVATVSPAHTSYNETMSTLRYASNAKSIINKPQVNEDANVKLIRELREEIERLKAMLLSFELRNFSSLNDEKSRNLKELVLQNELKIDQLAKDWTRKWNDWKAFMEHYGVDINRGKAGLVIHSSLPHLMALEDDVLSTGVVLYHLKEGTTKIGRVDSDQEQDIVLQGQWIERDHCTITSACGVVVLRPTRGARCTVNGREVTASCRLTQGAIITLGKTQKFRFNHPAEAAALRRNRQVGEAVVGGASLEWLDLNGDVTACRMGLHPLLWKESVLLSQDHSTTSPPAPGPAHQLSEQTPSEEHLPQTASYSPRTRSLNKNDFCFSGQGQLRTVRRALALKGVSLPGSCLTVSPRFASIQEMERVDRHPRQKVSQGSASLSQQANKLKPRDEPEVLTPASQSRRYKGLAESGYMQARWQQEGNLPTHKATRGASCGSSHPSAPKQTSGCKKADMTLQAKSERQQRVLADGVRGTAKKLFHLPHGIPVKREYSAAGPDTVAPLADSSPVVGHAGEEDDLSDTNSDYSEDSLSSVYAKASAELMKPEGPLGKKLDLPKPEHSERDDSHVSEDSLGERRYQTPSNSPEGTHLTSGPGSHKARMRACGKRACIVPSDSGLLAQARKSFSLDSLLDGEEELGEEQQEEFVLDSAEEVPTETFWHLQSSGVRAVDQETTNTSFYLDPPFQPHCEQPGSAVGACCHEKASSLPGMLPSRDSLHQESMDSWFSCDSKFNPSNPPGTVGSLSPNPLVQEFQLCGWEKPGYWLSTEEPKPSRIAVLPGSYTLLQSGAVLRCNTRDRHITPASDASKLSLWATHRFLQQGAGGTSQGRAVPDTAQQGTSEASNSSSVSNVLAASATSLPHLGTACDWDWSTVQQKYLLELSHPVLEATGEPRPDFPYFEEDSASLIQASDRGRDGLLPVGPGESSNQDFNNFSLHLAKSSHLRAEKEQESLSTKLEGPSHFFRTSEKEVHYNETSPADLESLPSGTTSAQVLAAEGKIADLMTEMCEVKQDNLEEYSQGSRKTGLMTSSEECFFLKNSCHGNDAVATKDHWLQGCMPLRKNIRGQPGQLRHSRHRLLQEKKADCQQSSRDTDFSFAFLSESELCLHPAPRGLLPSSLQSPPLETFYVTKSRDALTETALEIPACRKAGVCSVPLREAWPSSLDHHTLQNAYLENNLPALLQNQSSKLTSSQQITADSPVAPNSREVIELRQCPGNSEESYHSIYFSLAQNTSLFSFANTKICEFENQVGIINKKHGLALEDREKALTSSCCSVSSSSSVSGKPVFVCESGEGAQGKNAVLRQSHVLNKDRQIPSETKSDFFCKAISLGLRKNILGETPISLKSRAVDHNASSPVMAQDESPDHKWEGKNERGLLGKALHSQDSSDKLKLLGVDSTGETFWTIPSSQERNLSGCKQPRKLPERTKEEPSVKKQKTRVNSDEEMAKLIRSVMQLEHSVLEIESKQSKKLHGSYTQGVREEMVFQDQKADHVLKPGSPGDHLSFKDQPHSPKYHDGVDLKDSQVGEMKELGSCIGKDPQVQSPFKTREFIEEIQLVREHSRSAPLERSVGNTWDYLRTCTAFSVPADPSLHPGRMTALDKTLSLQTSHERSSKTQGKLLNVPASHQGQSYDLGSLAELETLKVFQKSQVGEHTSSLNQEDLKVLDGIEEMTLQMGQSLQEENRPVTSHRECPGPSQLCMSRFFSQETVCPLLSQTDSPIASSHQDLTNTLPFSSLRVPGSYFHPPDTVGIFSVDYVLNPTVFKIHDSPLVARVRDRDQSGYTRSHSPQGYVRGIASMAQSTWCGSAISVTIGAHGQSDTPESLSLEEEGRISASTTTQDQAGGIRSTFIHLSTRDDFGPEMETAIQKDRKRRASPLNRNSSQLEQKTSSPLEEGSFQDREARQKAANGAEDLSLTSDAISAPASLTGVPNPQPRTWESSAHASLCLALLEEIRQAKAQGRQLNDFLARRTVLPHSESLLEPRCSSWFPMRPQCKQMDQSVSGRTRNEGEAQGFHGAFLSAEPGQLLTDAGRASPKQGTLRPRALRRVELGDPSQCINWKGVIGSRLAEAYRPGSKHLVPSSLPDQTTSQNPRGVQMEAPFRRSEEIVDCDVSGSTEHSRSLSQSGGQEESQTPPSLQLSCSPCVTSQAYSLHSSTSLCCGSGSLEKGAAKPTPDSIHSPSIVPSRLGGLDERGTGHSREPAVLLAHGLKPRCRNRKFGSADCSTLEPLLTATVFSLAQGCSSSLAHERRASSLGHSSADGSTTSAESPERKFVEKKASTEFEAVPPVGTCCEPLMKLQDSCAANQATQASRTQSEPPAANGGLNAPQNLSEMSIKNELVVESYHRYGLEKTFRSLPEKPQLSAESRDHSSMDSQAEFVARLKQQGTQVDSLWEEEEQQRDQPLGGGGNPVQGGSPALLDEDDLDSQIKNARTKEEAVSKPGKFSPDIEDSATWHLRQSGPQPPGERPGQPRCGRKHPGSVPVIAVFSGPKDCLGPCPRPQFSVVSSTRSIQELNLSVEPPFPTDKDTQEPSRLWIPHPTDCCSKELEARTPKVEDHSQKASSDLDNRTGDHKPSKPAPLPSPVSSALLCQPTTDFLTSWMLGTLEQTCKGRPEKPGGQARPVEQLSEVDKKMIHIDSSHINPYILPQRPEGLRHVGWKQYVFDSAVDVSCSQTPQGLAPSSVAQGSSMDRGLEDQKPPFHPHLGACASAWDLSSICSSTENAQHSDDTLEVCGYSFPVGQHHNTAGPEGADKRFQIKIPPGKAGLRYQPPLTEGSATGPVDEVMLLCPTAAGRSVEQARMGTLEQGTQTLGCSLHWSCTDISATPEASTMPFSQLASWTSMHSLSLHLSQLLHSTSELLGSLSQPSVAEKEQNFRKDSPGKAPQALRMDSFTQTTVDEGSQTDLASSPLPLQAPEANPQVASESHAVLGSDTLTECQEKGGVPRALDKREVEETAGSSDFQEESICCRLQRPIVPSSHSRFEKDPLGQQLLSVGPQDSPSASLPPSSQPETSACLTVSSPSLSISHSSGPVPNTAEATGEPTIQKKLGRTSALLVDRASSPILTLSASAQGSCLLSDPSSQLLEGHQKPDSSPALSPDPAASPDDVCSQPGEESGDSRGVETQCEGGRGPLERSDEAPLLVSLSGDPQHCSECQGGVVGQPSQQCQPRTSQAVSTWVQKNTQSPPPVRSRSQRLAKDFVHEKMTSPECSPLSSRGPAWWQSRTDSRGESPVLLVEPQPASGTSPWGDIRHLSSCPVSGVTESTELRHSTWGPAGACQPEGLLSHTPQTCVAPEPLHHSLWELPIRNKFSNWGGVQDYSPLGLGVTKELGTRCDRGSGKQGERPFHALEDQSQAPEWPQREEIRLKVGAPNLPLSLELTEAKLHRGFGEADALLRVLQSGTGEALAAGHPTLATWEELLARQNKAIQTVWRERAEHLQNFRRTRSLSPRKQVSLLPNVDFPIRELSFPSRRRDYLQQLRKDVVETTRSSEAVPKSSYPPSDIELMLRDYQQAWEEAKVEIARARDRLREQTQQEKLRIHQRIISQLLREEKKLHTLANSSSLCTSSNGSLSSGVTSGYNSNSALSGQLWSPDSLGDTDWSDSRDAWMGNGQGRPAVKSRCPCLTGPTWKSSVYGRGASTGSCCCSPSGLFSSRTCFSSSYQDLARHIVDISVADVMAACSDNLHNLFIGQAAADWNYQGEEQKVQLYYKVFSSTRHGFLGAGVVSQSLPQVWAAVSDPTLWPLYHKPIQTARLHQRVTNSISLVYLLCGTTLCALKPPRDFCCVCVEAKEGHLSIMAAQSVYDTSMPRPRREVVRGEILPSAWILQPLTVEGKEVTRVICLAQGLCETNGSLQVKSSSFTSTEGDDPLCVALYCHWT